MASAPLRLRTEFLSNPKGVTEARPHLSWWVDDNRPAELQTAYHVMAASHASALDSDAPDLWDSGVVDAGENAHVEYDGIAPSAGQRVWWKVRTFDSDGLSSAWSEPAFFEMSPLLDAPWKARWIAAPLSGSRTRGVQVPMLRREFHLEREPESARLVIAALGDYRVEINGKRLIESPCSPVWSDWRRATYFQTCDVTGLLEQGSNCLGILLGDGVYSGLLPGLGRGIYGDRPAVIAELRVASGGTERCVAVTDHQWHWHTSWILGAEVIGGEHSDGRQRIADWSRPGLDELRWSTVDTLEGVDVALVAQAFPLDAVQQVLRPQNLPRQRREGGRVCLEYDFGSQIVGRCRLDLRCKASDAIELEYSLDDAFREATRDSYTSAAHDPTERFENEFALHSFRFLRVTHAAEITEIGDVHALRIALGDATGLSFRCDHPTINQLFDVALNSLRGVAQYAPWRGIRPDERMPAAGYLGTWIETLVQQGNYALAKKWVIDLQEALADPDWSARWAPEVPASGRAGDPLAAFEALVRGAWSLYRYYDEKALLQHCYPTMRAVALSYRHACASLLRETFDAELYGDGYGGMLTATASMYGALRMTGRIAGVLANLADYELMEAVAAETRKAFRKRFLTHAGHLAVDSQAACVAALSYGLLDDNESVIAQARLVELVRAASYHTDVPPALVRALLPTITEADRLDVAYMLIMQTSSPSWLHNVNSGLQLIARDEGRFDPAELGILQWLVGSVVGLSLDDDYSSEGNGFRKAKVRPRPPLGRLFSAGAPIQLVEASLATLNGRYEISWQIKDDAFEMSLVVPPSCRALVTLPDDIEQEVRSGTHRFVMDFDAGGDGVPTLLEMAGGR